MVRTDRFVGKRKVKDQWEEGGYVICESVGGLACLQGQMPSF